MDFNFWYPRKQLQESTTVQVKNLRTWIGTGNLTTSAFYPAITPFYQKKDDDIDLVPFIRVADTRKLLLTFEETVFLILNY